MAQKRLKAIRVPGFDLEESLYDAVDLFRQRKGCTWRSIFQDALEQLMDREMPETRENLQTGVVDEL